MQHSTGFSVPTKQSFVSTLFLPPPGKWVVRFGIAALSVCSIGVTAGGLARLDAARSPAGGPLASSSNAANVDFNLLSSVAVASGDACTGAGMDLQLTSNGKGGYTKGNLIRTASYGASDDPQGEEEGEIGPAASAVTMLGAKVGETITFRNRESLPARLTDGELPPGYVETEPGILEFQPNQGFWEATWGKVAVKEDGDIEYTAPPVQPYGAHDTITYTSPEGSGVSVSLFVMVSLDENQPAPEESAANAPVARERATAETDVAVYDAVAAEQIEEGWSLPISAHGAEVTLYVPDNRPAPAIFKRYGPINPIPDFVTASGYSPAGPPMSPVVPPPGPVVPPCVLNQTTTTYSGWQSNPPYETGWGSMGSFSLNVTPAMKKEVKDKYGIDINLGLTWYSNVKARSLTWTSAWYADTWKCKKNNTGRLFWDYVDTRECKKTGDGRLYDPRWMHVVMGWPEAGAPVWRPMTCRDHIKRSIPYNPPPSPGAMRLMTSYTSPASLTSMN